MAKERLQIPERLTQGGNQETGTVDLRAVTGSGGSRGGGTSAAQRNAERAAQDSTGASGNARRQLGERRLRPV